MKNQLQFLSHTMDTSTTSRKTSELLEVAKYIHLYELVEHSSYAVTIEDDKVILIGDVISLAM